MNNEEYVVFISVEHSPTSILKNIVPSQDRYSINIFGIQFNSTKEENLKVKASCVGHWGNPFLRTRSYLVDSAPSLTTIPTYRLSRARLPKTDVCHWIIIVVPSFPIGSKANVEERKGSIWPGIFSGLVLLEKKCMKTNIFNPKECMFLFIFLSLQENGLSLLEFASSVCSLEMKRDFSMTLALILIAEMTSHKVPILLSHQRC